MALKVFVSGCYDMLHSGHVAFFEEAATYGDLYVGIGSSQTVFNLKGRKTINTDAERLYMVKSLKAVKDAWINSGSGIIDFEEEVKRLQPDVFFVNTDGHSPVKEQFCRKFGIRYVVSERVPHSGLPARSTTALRQECRIPYRIDLAGGWLDQPFVNKFHSGYVVTVCIEPDYEFNDRSGMATSSRKKAIELWHTDIPDGDREVLAKTLFCFENPPGTKYVSGSQDSIGIVYQGLNMLYYDNDYWPSHIENHTAPELLSWLEAHLWLVPLYPRKASYDVLAGTDITIMNARALAEASAACREALLARDLKAWGAASTASFEYQIRMFPNMVTEDIMNEIESYRCDVLGWKLSGAGGGGYMVFVSDKPVRNAVRIRVRQKTYIG
ncbi:MAG: adenylyltransferase/cytidyltransferase family protein [Tannerella sp.]|jgi:cytidyltransferase-like protein|nr:adenylyltransferase/cytidyltransferase family protein [Tannerella sp.]